MEGDEEEGVGALPLEGEAEGERGRGEFLGEISGDGGERRGDAEVFAEMCAGVAGERARDLGDEVELGGFVVLVFAHVVEQRAKEIGGQAERDPAVEASAHGHVAGAGEAGREREFEGGRMKIGERAADGVEVAADGADEDGEFAFGFVGGVHEEVVGEEWRETRTRERWWFQVTGRM